MTRTEAIDISRWACRFGNKHHIRDRISRLSREAEKGERPWSDVADYLMKVYPERPEFADGIFEG